MGEVLCPGCPLCGESPLFTLGGGTQAFCGNRDGCSLIFWNPMLSLDDNLMDAGIARFPGEGGNGDQNT